MRPEAQCQAAFVIPFVTGKYLHIAGITVFTVRVFQKEFDPVVRYAPFPYPVRVSSGTAVQLEIRLVRKKPVLLPVKDEPCSGYPVCIPSRHLSHAWAVVEIVLRPGITQRYIGDSPFFVGNIDFHYPCTCLGKYDRSPGDVCHLIKMYFFSFGPFAPRRCFYCYHIGLFIEPTYWL